MSSDDEERPGFQALRQFRDGSLSVVQLHQALAPVARFRTSSEGRRSVDIVDQLTYEIEVDVPCVAKRLRAYLEGEISADELREWAVHLTLIPAYMTPGWEDDATADRHEPMWDVLRRISTPALDGDITPERVSGYLHIVERIAESEEINDIAPSTTD